MVCSRRESRCLIRNIYLRSVIHIVTDGTVDERILKALEAKDLTQSALIDAVKAEVGDGK